MQNTVQELLEGLERKEIKHPCPYSLQSIEESKGAENRKTVECPLSTTKGMWVGMPVSCENVQRHDTDLKGHNASQL